MDLRNKRILITGGTSGLGFELAQNLLNKGAHVFICAVSQDDVDKATIRLNSENAKGYICDISDYKQVQNLASEITGLDILINNAGIWLEGSLETNTSEEISKVIDVNLKGLILCTSMFLLSLKKREESFIINICSTAGVDLKPNQSVYAASKWGVRGFTESIKEDLKDSSVKVVGIFPGGMKTNLFGAAGINKEMNTYIDPKFIAGEIVHILEQDPSYISDDIIFRRTKF